MEQLPRTIREQIIERLREQVVSGALPPGESLKETDFAKRYGVSRGPVRDAFLSLAQEGLLLYQPNRGVTVNTPPKPENRELIASLRQQIEVFVVRQGLKTLSPESIAELEERLAELKQACDAEDSSTVARADLAFHETLLLACDGGEFLPIWKWLCSQMLMTYTRLESFSEAYNEHAEILVAVRSGKSSSVAKTLKSNIQ
ncbi:MAG: GntR family transcriptional regulator [Planctomycetota bacterium]